MSHSESTNQDILDWLSAPYHVQKHHEIRRKRISNTGRWFLESEPFRTWSENQYTSLCCVGDPGVGKSVLTYVEGAFRSLRFGILTVLSSLVIDHMQRIVVPGRGAVAYSYFDYRMPEFQTPEAFVASILRQLLLQQSQFPRSIYMFYEQYKNEDILKSSHDLHHILREVVASFESCYLVIDAFDECSRSSYRRSILKEILDCDKQKIHVFITSRPHCSEIQSSFPDSSVLTVKAHDDDVRAYCAAAIDSSENALEILDEDLKAQCLDSIAAHAQGM